MENEIQVYHDVTAFWLDKQWKTPREKELEKEVASLRQDIGNLKAQNENLEAQDKNREAQNKNLEAQNKALQRQLQLWSVFKDIPCDKCEKPMSNEWTRAEVLKAFAGWGHTICLDRW
jgi:septal ring factor EnvC (AmiA/AmiB activator)